MKRLNETMFGMRELMTDNLETVFKGAIAVIAAFFLTQLAFADCAGHFGEGLLVSVGALLRGGSALALLVCLFGAVTVLYWTEIAEGLTDRRTE